jgi:hypothetical protein
MNCPHCNQPNASENNFCSQCGQIMKQEAGIAAQQTIFTTHEKKSNADLGYMIVALLIFANVVLWLGWSLIGTRITDGNRAFYYMIRIISIGLAIGEFIVLFIFAKRAVYRIIIGIVGMLVALYNLFILIKTFKDLGGL